MNPRKKEALTLNIIIYLKKFCFRYYYPTTYLFLIALLYIISPLGPYIISVNLSLLKPIPRVFIGTPLPNPRNYLTHPAFPTSIYSTIRLNITKRTRLKIPKPGQKSQKGVNPGPLRQKGAKHTTVGIRWWSPTQLLIYRSRDYVWQSGRDAQFSRVCGRMYLWFGDCGICRVAVWGGEGKNTNEPKNIQQ
jgi:hypothetical protein